MLTSEFDSPYYLQTPYSHDGSCFSFTKLRNGNTCAVSKKFCYESFSQGIWIVINPLDSYNIEGAEEKFKQVKLLGVDLVTYMRCNNPDLDEVDKMRGANYSGRKPDETIQMIQDICRSQENDNYPYMGIMVAGYYTYDKQTYRKNWFEGSVEINFCGLNFPVPQGYIEVLKTTYGDYNKMPPIEKRVAWHPNEIFDTDKSYKSYLKSIQFI